MRRRGWWSRCTLCRRPIQVFSPKQLRACSRCFRGGVYEPEACPIFHPGELRLELSRALVPAGPRPEHLR